MIVLETERLLFRDHQPEDLDPYCAIEADPEVRRYIVAGVEMGNDESLRVLEKLGFTWPSTEKGERRSFHEFELRNPAPFSDA
jgi:RimJ/RimL family protein N-acetyltransferase